MMILCRLAAILGERKMLGQEPYTQAALARETGRDKNTISNLANNETTRYDAGVLSDVCRVLDVGVGDLLVYVPNGANSEPAD